MDIQKLSVQAADALRRLASIRADDGDTFDAYPDECVIRCEVTVGDIRAARRALAAMEPADCQHCGGHPGGVDGKGTPCPACGSPGLHRSDCAVNNGPALPVGECDCQPMAKAFIEDVRRSRWLEREHVRCQADCRDECRFPACKCPLRHTTDCDKTLLPGNPRAICTCGADANNRGREIRVNPDGSEYQPPPAPATEGKP